MNENIFRCVESMYNPKINEANGVYAISHLKCSTRKPTQISSEKHCYTLILHNYILRLTKYIQASFQSTSVVNCSQKPLTSYHFQHFYI